MTGGSKVDRQFRRTTRTRSKIDTILGRGDQFLDEPRGLEVEHVRRFIVSQMIPTAPTQGTY